MYGFKEYIPLLSEEVLKRVSEEEIFNLVIDKEIKTDRELMYKAPYRDDIHEGCYFEYFNNKLYFVDFTQNPINIDCFNIIERVYSLSHQEALKYINTKLNLGLGSNNEKVKKVLYIDKNKEKRQIKKPSDFIITLIPRKFNYKDKEFWSRYKISSQNLIEDGVIPISAYQSVSRKGKPFTITTFDIAYAYTGFKENKKKIYRPLAKNKLSKWFTNCRADDIGGLKQLPKTGNKLIISKSYKDCRVLKNQSLNSIWLQNEGMLPSRSLVGSIIEGYKEIIIWFDNDRTGLSSAKIMVEYLQGICPKKDVRMIFLPPKLWREEGIKDPSDYIYRKGERELIRFLNDKI